MVGVDVRGSNSLLPLEDSLDELRALADTAGLDVVGELTQKLDHIEPSTFIGTGKVEELKTWQAELDFDVVLFDDELSPRHQRNLEKELGDDVRVLDRTALILDIFAQHARTRRAPGRHARPAQRVARHLREPAPAAAGALTRVPHRV